MRKVKIKLGSKKFSHISTMREFYQLIGLYNEMTGDNPTIKYVHQMRANPRTTQQLLEILQKNMYQRDEYLFLSLQEANKRCSLDWIAFSPKEDETIPYNELWIDD